MPKDAAKMPESAWKLVFYTMSWSYSTYLLFFTSYSFFHDPPSVFYSKVHTLLIIKGPERGRKPVQVLRIVSANDCESPFHWRDENGNRCTAAAGALRTQMERKQSESGKRAGVLWF